MSAPNRAARIERMSEILTTCGLELPLVIDGRELFEICQDNGFSRYVVAMHLLDVSNTTGRSISLSDEYVVTINEEYVVSINRVIPVK